MSARTAANSELSVRQVDTVRHCNARRVANKHRVVPAHGALEFETRRSFGMCFSERLMRVGLPSKGHGEKGAERRSTQQAINLDVTAGETALHWGDMAWPLGSGKRARRSKRGSIPPHSTTSPTAALRYTARSAVSRAAERGEPEGIPASASTHPERGLSALQARSQSHAAGTVREPTRDHLRALVGWPHTKRHAAEGTALRSPGAAGLPRPRQASRLLRSGSDLSFARATGLLYSLSCRAVSFFAPHKSLPLRTTV